MTREMTREEAIRILEDNKPTIIFEDEETQKRMADIWNALDMAIQVLEKLSYLKDRPCEVCKCHTEHGCSEWSCVFEE